MDYLIIQYSAETIIAARFGVTGKELTFSGAAECALDHDNGPADIARQIGEGITGSPRVVLCLPPALCAHRLVNLPLTDARKVRDVLPAHLQGEIALPVHEALFDALPAGEGRWLAIWTRRAEVVRAIELLRDAGCEPQVVTFAPCAWPFLPGCPADVAICGDDAMTVVASGHTVFTTAFSAADRGKQAAGALAALEASGCAAPERIVVFGEHADEVSFPEPLAGRLSRLELPEEQGAVFKNEQNFQKLAGLAAVALAGQAGRLPDLRRGDLAWTADESALRRRLMMTAALTVVTAVMLFASQWLQYRAVSADIASLNTSIASLYREIFPNRAKAVDEVAEVKGEMRKLAASSSRAAALDLLKNLADAKGGSINGLFEIELDGRTLRIKGDARSSQAATEFKSALAPLFSSVELGEIKSRPDGGSGFTITATLKEAKP